MSVQKAQGYTTSRGTFFPTREEADRADVREKLGNGVSLFSHGLRDTDESFDDYMILNAGWFLHMLQQAGVKPFKGKLK